MYDPNNPDSYNYDNSMVTASSSTGPSYDQLVLFIVLPIILTLALTLSLVLVCLWVKARKDRRKLIVIEDDGMNASGKRFNNDEMIVEDFDDNEV